jgi:maltose-binding protein MalE
MYPPCLSCCMPTVSQLSSQWTSMNSRLAAVASAEKTPPAALDYLHHGNPGSPQM